MTERHKHADILIAIAEGKIVQYNSLFDKNSWYDYDANNFQVFNPLYCEDGYEWRVKPEVNKIEIISFINTKNGKIHTFFYKENEFTDDKQVLSRVVVEVPLDTYKYYFE